MKFILTSGTSSGGSRETVGTSGTTGEAKAASIATGYRLDADANQLISHVGHKVEITGTPEKPGSASPGVANGSVLSSAPGLKVESVRMIASSCPPP
jgi:hypothetical protein